MNRTDRRRFLKAGLSGLGTVKLAGRALPAAMEGPEWLEASSENGAAVESESWYSRTIRKLHFDMHTPGTIKNVGRDFDPQRFARAIKLTGVEAVDFFTRDAYGWSYYPTEIGTPHPHLTRDLFGDASKALKAEGIKVIAYAASDGLSGPQADAHPEWILCRPDGARAGTTEVSYPACVFSGFMEQALIPQLIEIARLYSVDGFFLDGVYQFFNSPCYCDACRRAFGREIPLAADDHAWRAFRHFQVQKIWDIYGNAAEKVAQARPGCVLGVNWMSGIRWSVPPPRTIGYLTGDVPLMNGTFETAYELSAWTWRQTPADIMNRRMLTDWDDFAFRTPESIETEFATALAAQAKLYAGDLLMPVEVRPDPEAMLLFRGCFEFAARREELTLHMRPQSDFAILSSPETLRLRGSEWRVDEAPLKGAFLALIEDGITVDILFDDDLQDHLARYAALLLPQQGFVSRGAARAIQGFVENGGGLVVIGALPSAIDPEEANSAADAATFEQITGLARDGEFAFDLSYVGLRGTKAENLWREGDTFRPIIPVPGRPAKVRSTGAEVLTTLIAPGALYQFDARPPGEKLSSPAITLHPYGKGQVAFCALPIASDIWRRGNAGAKYVLQALTRRVTSGFTVERVGTPSVRIYRTIGTKRTIVHLVSYQPDMRIEGPQSVESPSSVEGVQLRLRDPRTPASIQSHPIGQTLQARRSGAWLVVNVPSFIIHTALVFRWD
jgi:hypothetical protein